MLQSQSCKVTIPKFFLCANRDKSGEEAVRAAEEQGSWGRDGDQGRTLFEERLVDLWKIKSFIASLCACYTCLLQVIVFMYLVADTYTQVF